MNALARVDPFASALKTLEQDFPPRFDLEVEAHVFENVRGLDAAREIQSKMEGMKRQALELGYVVSTREDMLRRCWVYTFVRNPDATRPVKAVEPVVVPSLEA